MGWGQVFSCDVLGQQRFVFVDKAKYFVFLVKLHFGFTEGSVGRNNEAVLNQNSCCFNKRYVR